MILVFIMDLLRRVWAAARRPPADGRGVLQIIFISWADDGARFNDILIHIIICMYVCMYQDELSKVRSHRFAPRFASRLAPTPTPSHFSCHIGREVDCRFASRFWGPGGRMAFKILDDWLTWSCHRCCFNVWQSVNLFARMPGNLSIWLPECLAICQSDCPNAWQSVNLIARMPGNLSIAKVL